MIAQIDARLVIPDGQGMGPAEWRILAQAMAKVDRDYDGLVILFEPSSAVLSTKFVQAVAQATGRPIICAAGRGQREFSGRSNLVNAIHAATTDVAGVFFVDGSRILRAESLSLSAAGRIEGSEIGKVDFGLRLLAPDVRPRSGAWKILTTISDRVAIWPTTDILNRSDRPQTTKLAGVVIASESWRPLQPAEYRRCRERVPAKAALVVAGPVADGEWPIGMIRVAAPPMVAAIWLMVALGQGTNWRRAFLKLAAEPS